MDIRKRLVYNTYVESSFKKNEIIINDEAYHISDRIKKRLTIRKIANFFGILIIGYIYNIFLKTKTGNSLLGGSSTFLQIAIFFLMSILGIFLFSNIIIPKDIEGEVTKINKE